VLLQPRLQLGYLTVVTSPAVISAISASISGAAASAICVRLQQGAMWKPRWLIRGQRPRDCPMRITATIG
jgi:hypothetical protein